MYALSVLACVLAWRMFAAFADVGNWKLVESFPTHPPRTATTIRIMALNTVLICSVVFMPSVVMLNAVLLGVVMLNAVLLCVVMLNFTE